MTVDPPTTRREARATAAAELDEQQQPTRQQRRRNRRRATVRFVVVALSTLVVGLTAIDVANLFLTQHTLQAAADEAVAQLSVEQPPDQLVAAGAEARDKAKAIALSRVPISDDAVRTGKRSCSSEPGAERGHVGAQITYDYPLLGGVTSIALSATANRAC